MEGKEEEKKNDDASTPLSSSTSRNEAAALLWSEMLATPPGGGAFSPAKPLDDKDCLHGIGLQKGLERGKVVSRSGRRCALLLLETAGSYEQFGVALLKSCQANPLEGEAFKSIASLSQQTRQLASRIREEAALPLQGFLAAHGETLPAVHQKYSQARQRSYEARQRALLARSKYLKAVEEAKEACQKVKKEGVIGPKSSDSTKDPEKPESSNTVTSDLTDDNSDNINNNKYDAIKKTWEQNLDAYGKVHGQKAVAHVKHLLSDVKILQKRYESLVEKENCAVRSAQKMETVALEGLQKLEEQRVCLFFGSLVGTFEGIKECLDKLEISSSEHVVDYNESAEQASKRLKQKKGGDFFTTFLKVGIAQQAKTGGADAATLGLDEDVGKLRDQVQTRIAARAARIKKVKAMAAVFDDVSAAAAKLGAGLNQVVKQERSYASSSNKGAPIEQLRTLMANFEGPRTVELWKGLIHNMEKEAEACLQFSRSINSIKSSKLDHFLLANEKDLHIASDQDDARWKHLCDAARTEMRAEAKYRQSAAQTAKARERISSMEQAKESSPAEAVPRSPQKTNRARDGMNKALGNMFKILPDGGEQAMSMLTADVRRSVVERSLQEADENELKLRQALDQAITSKNTAVDLYKSKAEPLVKKYEMEHMSGVEDIKAAMELLVSCLENLRKERYEALAPFTKLGPNPLGLVLLDAREWTEKTAQEVTSKTNQSAAKKTADEVGGFMLSVNVESDRQVLYLAGIERSNSFDSDASEAPEEEDDDDSMKETSVRSAPQRLSRPSSANSLDLLEEEKQEKNVPGSPSAPHQQTARWLHKSFSTPMGKPDAFKKKNLRRFNSMDDPVKEGDDQGDDLTENSTLSTNVPPQTATESLETDCFYAFWSDYDGAPPAITYSFACAYFPKDCTIKDVASIEHGRLFLTHKNVVFVAWRGKKAIFLLSNVLSVVENKSLFGVSDDTLLITAQTGKHQPTLLLGNFTDRDNVLKILQDVSASAQKAAESEKLKDDKLSQGAGATIMSKAPPTAAPVAPDATMKKMENVLSKKLGNVPIEKFHQLCWLGDTKSDEKSFYAQWMDKGDCYDIHISDWEQAEGGIKGPWCGETYSHKRVIDFKFKRKSHLYIGPPIAEVKQTQYCRVDGDRSVMQMTVAFDGIPYSDAFSVEVRWVATRSGTQDISVEVGVFVVFHKNTMLKSKIRSGTVTETKPAHTSLFTFVKTALGSDSAMDETPEEVATLEEPKLAGKGDVWDMVQNALPEVVKENLPDVVKDNMHVAIPLVIFLFLFLFHRLFFSSSYSPVVLERELLARDEEIVHLNEKVDQMQAEMKLMRQSLEEIVSLLQKQSTS